MKFNSIEEIEKWFKDFKYEEEVHNAIDFLLKKNAEQSDELVRVETELMMLR